jgi:hypothetical protein
MTPVLLTAVLLALIVMICSLRWWRNTALRAQPRRLVLLVALQVIAATLLYVGLYPPARPLPSVTYALFGPGANQADADAAIARGQRVLRLPEAPALAEATRVPDLASALRLYPDLREVQLLGDGLPARDRDVRAVPLQFTAPPLRGLVDLQPPSPVAPGNRFTVSGQLQGVAQAQLELLDPAGRIVDHAQADERGTFQLHGSARAEGRSLFQLRVRDAGQATLETVPVPVDVIASPPARLWLIAGAPGAETKYLQRWASNAGLPLHQQISLGGGIQLGDAPRPLTTSTLSQSDLLVLDERSLVGLGSTQRAALRQAINDGLGVLIRLGSAPDAAARNALAQLGLPLRGDGQIRRSTLETGKADAQRLALLQGPRAHRSDSAEAAPALERLQLELTSASAAPLLRDTDDAALGYWRALGQGRVGVLLLTDSFKLVLAGRDELHASLWSELLATLGRAQAEASANSVMQMPSRAWAGQRTVLCGINDGDTVTAPDTTLATLRSGSDTPACAAYWPRQPGWHVHQSGAAFHVFDPASAASLHRADMVHATLEVAASSTRTQQASALAAAAQPGPRWSWLLAFLLSASALWWLERRPLRKRE